MNITNVNFYVSGAENVTERARLSAIFGAGLKSTWAERRSWSAIKRSAERGVHWAGTERRVGVTEISIKLEWWVEIVPLTLHSHALVLPGTSDFAALQGWIEWHYSRAISHSESCVTNRFPSLNIAAVTNVTTSYSKNKHVTGNTYFVAEIRKTLLSKIFYGCLHLFRSTKQ